MAKTVKRCGEARNAWYEWLDPSQDRRCPTGQIVYEVQATNNGVPIPIGRPGGTDSDGILYIGETDVTPGAKSRSRYRLLVRSFTNPRRKNKHSAAEKYFAGMYQGQYPLTGIRVRYKIMALPRKPVLDGFTVPDGKVLATTSEYSEIDRYEERFGELPPLNDIRGKKAQGGRLLRQSPKSADKAVKLGKDPYKLLRNLKKKSP